MPCSLVNGDQDFGRILGFLESSLEAIKTRWLSVQDFSSREMAGNGNRKLFLITRFRTAMGLCTSNETKPKLCLILRRRFTKPQKNSKRVRRREESFTRLQRSRVASLRTSVCFLSGHLDLLFTVRHFRAKKLRERIRQSLALYKHVPRQKKTAYF
jgi:hypothetical protein